MNVYPRVGSCDYEAISEYRNTLQTFDELGSPLTDHVEVREVAEAAYRVHFPDSSSADLLYDVSKMCQQLNLIEEGAG